MITVFFSRLKLRLVMRGSTLIQSSNKTISRLQSLTTCCSLKLQSYHSKRLLNTFTGRTMRRVVRFHPATDDGKYDEDSIFTGLLKEGVKAEVGSNATVFEGDIYDSSRFGFLFILARAVIITILQTHTRARSHIELKRQTKKEIYTHNGTQ